LPPQNAVSFECPFCGRAIAIAGDSYPFVRSQIIVHLDACPSRSPEVTSDQITRTADDIARRLRT
jgi:hypothetical protein